MSDELPAPLIAAPTPDEPDAVELQLPVINLQLSGVKVDVRVNPDTGDRLLLIGPVVLNIGLPFDAAGARNLARDLTGGIELATNVSPIAQIVRR